MLFFQQEAASPGPLITLRPYQRSCVERVLTAYEHQSQGGKTLMVIPTGGGKTVIFAEVVRRLHLRTLVIAHRQELLEQAADKLRFVDPTAMIGQVGAGRSEWGAPITCASIQTISRPEHRKALKLFGYQLVIIDEAHHACAESYRSVLRELPDAFVLGVTATPDRTDKQSLSALFGEPVFATSILDLVEQGYLCDLRAIAIHTTTSLDSVHLQGGDYQLEELEQVIDTPERNERIVRAYLHHCRGRQTVCFSVTVEHAQHLATVFNHFEVPAAVVSGETPSEERRSILHAYERGTIKVVCNCGVLLEGFDAPQTSCIVMTRPTKSRPLYAQAVGRGTRLAPGKDNCIVLDITDNCIKHRLAPLTLGNVIEKPLHDGESIRECQEREAREKAAMEEEREHQERTTKVTKRGQDLSVNILARFEWRRGSDGVYRLEVGAQKHRILLVPSETTDGYYSIWAKLAPTFKKQQWMKEVPLEWAQQHAEMKARLMEAGEQQVILVDTTAAWRGLPVTDGQRFMLQKYHLPFDAHMTRGEAADLIGYAKAQEDRRKAQEKAEKVSTRAGAKPHRKARRSA